MLKLSVTNNILPFSTSHRLYLHKSRESLSNTTPVDQTFYKNIKPDTSLKTHLHLPINPPSPKLQHYHPNKQETI